MSYGAKTKSKFSWIGNIIGVPIAIIAMVIGVTVVVGGASIITIAALLCALLLALFVPLTLEGQRTWKALLITGFVTIPFFHIAFWKLYGLSKIWAFFSALGTVVIVIPLLWGGFSMLCLFLGYLIVFLFASDFTNQSEK